MPLREGGTRAARRARSAAWEEEPSSRIAMVPVATPDRVGGTAAGIRPAPRRSPEREEREGQKHGAARLLVLYILQFISGFTPACS